MQEQSWMSHESGVEAAAKSDRTWREIAEEISKESDSGKIGELANELIANWS